MYGIMTQSGDLVLCQSNAFQNAFVLKRWSRNAMPAMRESAIEIDQLMQEFMAVSNRYDLQVFIFTEEQEQQLLMRKLIGRYYFEPSPLFVTQAFVLNSARSAETYDHMDGQPHG